LPKKINTLCAYNVLLDYMIILFKLVQNFDGCERITDVQLEATMLIPQICKGRNDKKKDLAFILLN